MGTAPTVLVAEDCRGGCAEEGDESAVLVFMAALILNYLFIYLFIYLLW